MHGEVLLGSAGFDHGADGVDNAVDVRLVHWHAVYVAVGGVVRVDLEILARLEKSVRMPSSTI